MATTTTKRPTCTWYGVSGMDYTFHIYDLPVQPLLNAGQDGNYIYARRNAEGAWVPIYIGQGDLRERSGPSHHQASCIRRKGATHFHCHLNGDVRRRLAEEADLLANYSHGFEPRGCNERAGHSS